MRTPHAPGVLAFTGIGNGRPRPAAAAPAATACTTGTPAAHRADIQGLRAVAVVLVMLAHAGVGLFAGGFVGVDVFFVLSGFLITGLLLAEARKKGSVSLVEFYVRRARRILPAAALTLVVTDVAAFFLLNVVRGRTAVVDSLNAAAFAANFHFSSVGVDYFSRDTPPSPILHFWSLSVEEQFYFVWPLLLSLALFGVLARRHGMGRLNERRLLATVAVLALASLAWSIHSTQTEPAIAYFSPFTRAWELALGATLAVGATTVARTPKAARLVLGWVGVLAIAYAAIAFSDGTPFPGALALLPTVGTALAIVAGMGEASRISVTRLLSLRPMRFVGDRSYALYLWHWPVLILAAGYAGHELGVATNLGLMLVALGVSCVSYAVVEDPIRRRTRSRKGTVLVVAVATAAVLGTASASLAAIGGEQTRFETRTATPAPAVTVDAYRYSRAHGALPAVVASVRAARRGAPIPSVLDPPIRRLRAFPKDTGLGPGCILQDSRPETRGAICRLAHPASRKVMVLLGDSHAFMWLTPVLELARKDGWTLIPLIRLGCMPGTWVTNDRGCRDWYRWAVAEIDRLHPTVTLVGGKQTERPGTTRQAAVDSVIATAQELRHATRVVLIGDPESLGADPVECLLGRGATMARCSKTWPAEWTRAYDEVARRAPSVGAAFLPTRPFVCFQRTCPAVIGHTIAWMDDNHLSLAYATAVAVPFRAAFRDVLAGRAV